MKVVCYKGYFYSFLYGKTKKEKRGDIMQISIDEIRLRDGRRKLDTDHIKELADSIQELGLLNPITIDREYFLIAGLHRLEAAKQLGWTKVECTVSSLEGLQAELAEIDENFVRNDLSAVEYGEMLLRRKEIYEMLHPETKATYDGGSFRGNQHKNVVSDKMSLTRKSFVQDTADKLGVAPRTVERQIKTAKNLAPEAKEIIKDTDIRLSKKTTMELSRLEPEQQKEAAVLLAAKEISKVAEYKTMTEKTADMTQENKKDELTERNPTQNQTASDSKTGGEVVFGVEKEIQNGLISKLKEPELQLQKMAGQETEAITPELVSVIPEKKVQNGGASLKEIIAELKDPDKDCSGTPDSFLQEYTAFVRKFHRELDWYSDPYYDTVYPCLTKGQLAKLKGLVNSLCQAAEDFFQKVENAVKQKGQELI